MRTRSEHSCSSSDAIRTPPTTCRRPGRARSDGAGATPCAAMIRWARAATPARPHLGDAMFLEGLGSVNGTRIKDQLVKRGDKVLVTAGETIHIGSSVLIIQYRSSRPALSRPETLRDEGLSATVGSPQDEAM